MKRTKSASGIKRTPEHLRSILIYPSFRSILYILLGYIQMFSGVFQKSLRITFAYCLYVLISFFSLRKLIFSEGVIGLRHEWAIPPYRDQLIMRFIESFYMINPISGEPHIYYTQLYYKFIESVFSLFFSIEGDIMSKVILIFLLSTSGISMFYLSRNIGFGYIGSFLSGLFYMFAPGVFVRVTVGHVLYLFSYAISPFILSLFIFSVIGSKDVDWKKLMLSSILYAISWVQIQFALLIPFVLFTITVVFLLKTPKNVFHILKSFIIFFAVGLALNSYWILPYMFGISSKLNISQISSIYYYGIYYGPDVFTTFTSAGFPFPSDYSRLLSMNILPKFYYLFVIFFPLIAYASLIIDKKKDSFILSFAMIALIGIFLMSGIHSPLSELWEFLYLHIPLMRVFRELHSYYFLISISYSVLVGKFASASLEQKEGGEQI